MYPSHAAKNYDLTRYMSARIVGSKKPQSYQYCFVFLLVDHSCTNQMRLVVFAYPLPSFDKKLL